MSDQRGLLDIEGGWYRVSGRYVVTGTTVDVWLDPDTLVVTNRLHPGYWAALLLGLWSLISERRR